MRSTPRPRRSEPIALRVEVRPTTKMSDIGDRISVLVVSDTHIYNPRSRKNRLILHRLRRATRRYRHIVLAGDIFEFLYQSPLIASPQEVLRLAERFLCDLIHCAEANGCQIHYTIGNHEEIIQFWSVLRRLDASSRRFAAHLSYVGIGDAVFSHGDQWLSGPLGLSDQHRESKLVDIRAAWRKETGRLAREWAGLPVAFIPGAADRPLARAVASLINNAAHRILPPLMRRINTPAHCADKLKTILEAHNPDVLAQHRHFISGHVHFAWRQHRFITPFGSKFSSNSGCSLDDREFNPLEIVMRAVRVRGVERFEVESIDRGDAMTKHRHPRRTPSQVTRYMPRLRLRQRPLA